MVVWDESGGSYEPGQQYSDFPFIEVLVTPLEGAICKIQSLVTAQFIQRQRGETKLPTRMKSFQKVKEKVLFFTRKISP